MKKLFFVGSPNYRPVLLFLFAISLVALLWKCQKDGVVAVNSVASATHSAENRTDSTAYWLGLVSQSNGRLVFQNMNHFVKVLSILEAQIETHAVNFLNTYPNATGDALDSLTIATNFNPYQPMVNFENSKSFTSQRANTKVLMDAWLNDPAATDANSPGQTRSLDPTITALVNESGEAMVGGQVERLTVKVSSGVEAGICVPYGVGFKSYGAGNNRRLWIQIQLEQFGLIYSRLVTSAENWKKSWGIWHPAWRNIRLDHKKDPNYTVSCDPSFSFNDFHSDFKNRFIRLLITYTWTFKGGMAHHKIGTDDTFGNCEIENVTTVFKVKI